MRDVSHRTELNTTNVFRLLLLCPNEKIREKERSYAYA